MRLPSVAIQQKSVLFIGTALSVFAFAAPAVAVPVTYTIEGTGSGSLDGTSFTNDLVTVTIPGDTINIQQQTVLGSNVFRNLATGPATVTVTGVGTDTLAKTAAFVNQRPTFLEAGFSSLTGDSVPFFPPSVDPFWTTMNNAFASNGLDTSIGPVDGTAFFARNALSTGTGGSFNLTSMDTSTFTADVVPLPATFPLFGSGLGALGLLGWRRKRRTQSVA